MVQFYTSIFTGKSKAWIVHPKFNLPVGRCAVSVKLYSCD